MTTWKRRATAAGMALALGLGLWLSACGPAPRPAGEKAPGQEVSPRQAAEGIHLAAGLRLVVERTLAGAAGGWPEMRLAVTEVGADTLRVRWETTLERETEASRQRRWAFEEDPPVVGVGEQGPEPPRPEFETLNLEGALAVTGRADARVMTPPSLWGDGDTGRTVSGNGLLWLSPAAFRELRATRTTRWGLTSFDATTTLLFPDSDEFHTLEAEADFRSLELEVDGEPTAVQVIVAGNRYLTYTVLDNEQNPLVLRLGANPLADWTDLFTLRGPLLKTSLGYRVTAIERQ